MSGWDPMEEGVTSDITYFSGEDDGHQVKKGWVYAVPSESIDADANSDDEEKYMYFNNSGSIVADQFKKINGKYYVFNRNGIMKDGIVIWAPNGTSAGTQAKGKTKSNFVTTLDLDWANGSDVAKKGILRYDSGTNQYIKVDTTGRVVALGMGNNDTGKKDANVDQGDMIKLHYYGSDGARRTGLNNVEFADDVYTLNTVGNTGDKGTGVFSKKYYSLGILLKASGDIRYGIYQEASNSMLKPQKDIYNKSLINAYDSVNEENYGYLVLTTSGAKQKGNNTAKKDADGNYWMIDKSTHRLKGIYSVGIKDNNTLTNFKTKSLTGGTDLTDGQQYTAANIITDNNDAENYLFTENFSIEAINRSNVISISQADYNNATDFEKANSIVYATTDEDGKPVWRRRQGYFTCHKTDSDEYYFTFSGTAPCFQSDYLDGSNKWIPFGMLDNAYKTATFNHTTNTDAAAHGYDVTPNDDYFLNCYWAD